MIGKVNYCLDIAQQLHAIEKAIDTAIHALIQNHLNHWLEDSVGALGRDRSDAITALQPITKYL